MERLFERLSLARIYLMFDLNQFRRKQMMPINGRTTPFWERRGGAEEGFESKKVGNSHQMWLRRLAEVDPVDRVCEQSL